MSSSIYAINFWDRDDEKREKLTKQKETILLLLQDDHQENLFMLPHDIRREIASFMIESEPWHLIQKTTKK